MGRNSEGLLEVKECRRIELKFLLDSGYIQKGKKIKATLSWSDGSTVGFESHLSSFGSDGYINLNYTRTSYDGDKQSLDYKIYLVSVPSNLGKGNILYFECPSTYRMCKILYCAYGSPIYKSRYAYNYRLYYPSQLSSKYHKYLDKLNHIEKQIEKLEGSITKSHYQGKPTKKMIRLEKLEAKYRKYDCYNARVFDMMVSRFRGIG